MKGWLFADLYVISDKQCIHVQSFLLVHLSVIQAWNKVKWTIQVILSMIQDDYFHHWVLYNFVFIYLVFYKIKQPMISGFKAMQCFFD